MKSYVALLSIMVSSTVRFYHDATSFSRKKKKIRKKELKESVLACTLTLILTVK